MDNEQKREKALRVSDVVAILHSDNKMQELLTNRSRLYTSYSVKDKKGAFRPVIDMDSVIELLREVLNN